MDKVALFIGYTVMVSTGVTATTWLLWQCAEICIRRLKLKIQFLEFILHKMRGGKFVYPKIVTKKSAA